MMLANHLPMSPTSKPILLSSTSRHFFLVPRVAVMLINDQAYSLLKDLEMELVKGRFNACTHQITIMDFFTGSS